LLIITLACLCPGHAQDSPEVANHYLDCLERFHGYACTIWHDSAQPPDSGYFGDGASGGNGGIRGTCGVLVSYATLLRGGRGEKHELIDRLRKGLRYAALTHRVSDHQCRDGKQWGGSWQSALWAGSLGFAAAMAADELPPALVKACKQVVAFEADRLAEIPPASGWRGDSKAEENGWNSNAVSLAAAWMADDPRAQGWAAAAKRYLVNTYTVADTSDDPLREWITTTTLHPSFTCENHGFFHPSYQMVSGMSMGDSLLMAKAVNPQVAEALAPFAEHNVLPVWRRLSNVLLDSGEVAYPSGLDWALHGYGQVPYLAWLTAHFGDPLARWAEGRLVGHLAHRQSVNPDGRFTGDSVPNGFYREAVMARRVALAWWQHLLGGAQVGPATPPGPMVEHMPDVKLIVQRSPEGFISLSYGARIMALVAPSASGRPKSPYVTTPRYPGLIGRGASSGPTSARAKSIAITQEGFEALLTVQFGPLESRTVKLSSFGDCVAIIEAPRLLLQMGGLPSAAFPIGVENHALTGGARELTWQEGARSVEAMCGEGIEALGRWVCVSGRLGCIAGPEGNLGYQVAGGYNRRGAAEDHLHFIPASPSMPRYAIVLPDADADTVRRVARGFEWATRPDGVSLEFVSPRGKRRVVQMALAAEPVQERELIRPSAVTAGTRSAKHPEALACDGDPATFWVSNRDGSKPGHGPTPEQPEWLEFTFAADSQIDEIILMPRPAYGPKDISLSLNGDVVYEGKMGAAPLRIALKQPTRVMRARLTMTSSHDPRYPNSPRNVQVAEVLFTLAHPAAPESHR